MLVTFFLLRNPRVTWVIACLKSSCRMGFWHLHFIVLNLLIGRGCTYVYSYDTVVLCIVANLLTDLGVLILDAYFDAIMMNSMVVFVICLSKSSIAVMWKVGPVLVLLLAHTPCLISYLRAISGCNVLAVQWVDCIICLDKSTFDEETTYRVCVY